MQDRMFHVLVLGGLALVGCGGSVQSEGKGVAQPDGASGQGSSSGSSAGSGSASWSLAEGGASGDAAIAEPDEGGADVAAREASATASSQDAAVVDAHGHVDANPCSIGGFPCEAPPPM